MKQVGSRLLSVLLWGDTPPTRFFLALLDICMVMYMMTPQSEDDFVFMMGAFNSADSQWLWSALFLAHACALIKGLTGKFSFVTLLLEGVLGCFIWGIAALTNLYAQHWIPGPMVICLMMQMWLLFRYPTHMRGGRLE